MSWGDWVSAEPARIHAGRWEQTGEDYYTCVPPPGCEPDPAAVKAIHEFDPGAIPIWRIQLWRVPGLSYTRPYVHAGIARRLPSWRVRKPLQVTMPQGAEHEAPNTLSCFFEGPAVALHGPGEYQAFGWAAYYWCRSKGFLTVEKYDAIIRAKKERYAEMRRKHQEELDYRRKQVEPYLLKKAATLSDADWERYRAAQRVGMRRAGLKQRKPFVYVRGVAPLAGSTRGSHPPKE